MQIWIRPGGGLAEDYLQLIESFTANNTEATMVALLAVFALFHSGLAGLRPKGEGMFRPGDSGSVCFES
jgi:zeta-carotene isomerase